MEIHAALVRKPSPSFINAISSHPEKSAIDFSKALGQHERYVEILKKLRVKVIYLPPLKNSPDATFVEDTAVILEGKAVICPVKEKSRKGESASVAEELRKRLPLVYLPKQATLDGGDVLMTPDKLFVGLSRRTNKEAADALAALTQKPVIPVPVYRGLHLKSAVSYLGKNTLVLDPEKIDTEPFKEFDWIPVSEKESYAGNTLTINQTTLLPAGFSETAQKIQSRGFQTVELEMTEFQKADGALSCLSLLIPHHV